MDDVREASRAEEVVDRLGLLYEKGVDPDEYTLADASNFGEDTADDWTRSYGAQEAFESLVRTILSQNTSDAASKPAFHALETRYGDELVETLAGADVNELAVTIRHAGLHHQKSRVIIGAANRVLDEWGGAEPFDTFVKDGNPDEVRSALLDIDGVGPKTADCVLLFAGGREGVFPVDTHVHRIYRRLGVVPPAADHETVRAILEREVPPQKCGFGHTSSIQFGRDYCEAQKPICLDRAEACPLSDLCEQVGIDAAEGNVQDPVEVSEANTGT